MSTASIEFTRQAIRVAQAFMALPANERQEFERALAGRAEAWGRCEDAWPPAPWPIVVRVEQDSRVSAEG